MVRGIGRIVADNTAIERVNELLTMHLGPRDVLLNLSVDFKTNLTADQVEDAITGLEDGIKAAYPEISRVFIEAQGWKAHRERQRRAGPEDG